jgi:hypothetical protein
MSQRKILFLLVGGLLIIGLGLFFGATKAGAFTTGSSGYANNGAPQTDAYAGDTNVLIMDISLPDPLTDSCIVTGGCGGTPTPGSAIDTANPWASATVPVLFYWSATADGIFTDDDQDGVYTADDDTPLDCDGTTTTAVGTCSAAAGTALVAVESGTTALENADGLCTDDVTAPTVIFHDSDGNCGVADGVISALVGTAATTTPKVLTDWAFVDTDADGAYDVGEELYLESCSGELTVSLAADTPLAGTAPAGCTALNSTNPWASATVPVFFYDDGDNVWQSANDGIFTDDDQSGYYNGDKISSVVVQNLENALDDDISAIKIWQEDGTTAGFQSNQDTLIGSDITGAKWGQTISTGSAVVYTASTKDRIYITVDISSNAVNGRRIQAKIPVNGLQFVSTNDGPTNVQIVNPYVQTIVSREATVDNIAPTSSITDPEDGARIDPGVDYTIQGTCSDEGGSSVKQVEISLDGGQTWHLATPLQATDSGFTWSYLWQSPQEGTYTIKTRATDWIGNTETPGDGITVKVAVAEEEEEVEEQPSEEAEEQPSVEKPIEEMTIEELKAKIMEIQQKIVELLQQLIEMIKEQILELGGRA